MNLNLFSKVRKLEKPPYVVDRSRLRRFNSKNTIFNRVRWDTSYEGYMPHGVVAEDKSEYLRVDFALAQASRAVQRALGSRGSSSPQIRMEQKPCGEKLEVDDPHEMNEYIRRAARLFGASLVGICKLNRDWLYQETDVPEIFENVIVMAVKMDADAIASSPAPLAAAATGVGYSKMAFTLTCMGEFIRNLGYEAIQCGNDTALSIPLAIDAGLGELGRNGLLITPQYGPRVRLCKIFTNLLLEPDNPIEFGVKEFCKKCKLCAENCPAAAISMDDEPSYEAHNISNNPGALKWYVNAEKCHLFWRENGTSCSTCIKACPYNITSTKRGKVTT